MVFLHGLGGSDDLPIPAAFAIAGAAAALAISFTVLAIAWRTPRFDAATRGTPVALALATVLDSSAFAWALRILGLAFTAYIGWAAIAGPDLVTNPFFGVVYVWLWVGLIPVSLLFGPFYKAINPVRTLHLLLSRVTGISPSEGLVRLPAWVGLWPAALGLFAFVWMELVYERSTYLVDLRLWFAIYLAVVFVGAAIFGDRWIESADPFEVFSTLVGRLSVFGRIADGSLVVRNPLGNLDGTPASPGLTGVVAVLLGSTAFDSFSGSPRWVGFVQSSDVDRQLLNTLCLLAFCVGVFLLFVLAVVLTGVHQGDSRWRLPDRFAHAVVPIIVGYFVAHYLSYFYYIGQLTLVQLSDPMVRGDNYLGTADLAINQSLLLQPTLLAVLKVLAIVVGHVLGVIASHDRAIKLLPRRSHLTGQLPLLVLMLAFTVGGLYLLLTS